LRFNFSIELNSFYGLLAPEVEATVSRFNNSYVDLHNLPFILMYNDITNISTFLAKVLFM
jgi:hypothetical protein